MQHISKSLKALMEGDELGEAISGQRSLELWAGVVGPKIAARTKPLRFRSGVLVVEVADSTWHHEMSFLRRTIASKLNAELGRNVVQSIHLVLAGALPGGEKGH